MPGYDGWELLRDENNSQREKTLGSGGQGTVYLARSPERVRQMEEGAEKLKKLLRDATATVYPQELSVSSFSELAQKIIDIGGPDPVNQLGALKRFKISDDDKNEEAKAVGRLESEVRSLREIKHPAVLKLKHENVGERFIVTEYHQRGALAKNLNRYKGDAVAALQAFRALVDGVCAIHDRAAIHRDIKAENIFLAASGDLVLGDFGIVFFQDGGRLTSTVERVGSHYWMAPWAYKNERLALDEINFKLDIYPLGKVLWSMIAGRNGFFREEYRNDENNLARLFPDDPTMPLINDLLDQCVVRNERECALHTALDLRIAVDGLIDKIKARRGQKTDGADTWPCRLCGKGNYRATHTILLGQISGHAVTDRNPLAVYVCDNVNCRHAELFGTN